MTPTVTRLRLVRPGWVAVELDDARWRTLPAEAVVRAGLAVGSLLSRPQAAVLARERRRAVAVGAASAALARRDLTRAELAAKLERKGVAPVERERALETVARAGLQDDTRAAHGRAARLAERGYGDDAIRADLEQRGVEAELREQAVAALPAERERAVAIVAKLGPGVRTAQTLARRGFAEEIVVAAAEDAADGPDTDPSYD